MNFIFGTRGTSASPIHTGQSCPACGKEDSILMMPYQRYFHLLQIPLFPTTKHFIPAVSYTHLDVYKRQGSIRMDRSGDISKSYN